MALIAMCCHDTEENKRTEYTDKTLRSINNTVNFNKHRLIVINNNSCKKTTDLIHEFFLYRHRNEDFYSVIDLPENIGTAGAINLAWRTRRPGENCIKIDNDVVFPRRNESDWIEKMEEVIVTDPTIGQVGLKRKDCWESPDRTDFYKSELKFLPHHPGERWIAVEEVNHVMGTCVMHSSALLNKVGYLYQPALYGFDDSLMSFRSKLAGFRNVFLPSIEIDHIDRGDTGYQKWKENHASEQWKAYHEQIRKYQENPESIYYNPYE